MKHPNLHESGRPATDVATERKKSPKATKPTHFPFLNIVTFSCSLLLFALIKLPQFWNIEIYNNTQHHDSRSYIRLDWILSYVPFLFCKTLWYSPHRSKANGIPTSYLYKSVFLLFPTLRYKNGGLKTWLSNYITENIKQFNTGKKSYKMLVQVLPMTNTWSNLWSSYGW